MTNDAPKAMSFHWRHFLKHILNHRPANRDEGVAIIETERRELVALAAEVESLAQGQFTGTRSFPEFLRGRVTVGGGFVERVLFLAETGIDGDDCLPGLNQRCFIWPWRPYVRDSL